MHRTWIRRFFDDRRPARPSKNSALHGARRLSVESLESRQMLSASSPTEIVTPDHMTTTLAGAAPLDTSGPTGMTPTEIKSAYGINAVSFGSTAANGAGTTIAIVDAYDDPNIANDLHQFDVAFGLADPTLTKENQSGGSTLPAANSGWITEIALDVEWSHAIAPGANILLVEANSDSMSDLMAAENTARNTAGVVAVSMSWGGGEFSGENSYDSDFTTPAGHTGEAFFVSSGDDGAPISYPAASPNVVSVGGTTLTLSGSSYGSESAWSGSGGGISAYEAQPAYQKGVVTQSTTFRTNPDVSYDADPNSGFPVYDSYNNGTKTPWGQWGGTSDAAPQWAALTAIADQGRELDGLSTLDGASQLLPALYQLPTTDFHDVTTGTSTGSPNESAGPGYDLATGRGTPVANLLIPALVAYAGSGGGGGGGTTTAPTAPTNFTAQATSSSQVSLSWGLSSGATSYDVYYETTGGSPTLSGAYGASTTSATVSGLKASTAYSFEVVALNSAGSAATKWVSATTLAGTTLTAPGNFTVSATSSTQASLSWTASSGATSYSVYEKTSTGISTLIGTLGATATSATVSGLTAGATYSFEVVASSGSTTASTAWVSVTMPTAGTLQAPANFTVTATSNTVAHLAWSASTGATGYTIYWWNGTQAVSLGSVGATVTSANVSGLVAGSTDKFYVTAFNASTSASTAWVSVTMPGSTSSTLTAPQNVTATATSATTGTLTWTASSGATGYRIYWISGNSSVLLGSVSASATSVTITGMSASTSYSFEVVAYNATSTAASAVATLTTPAATPAPKSLTPQQLADLFYSMAAG